MVFWWEMIITKMVTVGVKLAVCIKISLAKSKNLNTFHELTL